MFQTKGWVVPNVSPTYIHTPTQVNTDISKNLKLTNLEFVSLASGRSKLQEEIIFSFYDEKNGTLF